MDPYGLDDIYLLRQTFSDPVILGTENLVNLSISSPFLNYLAMVSVTNANSKLLAQYGTDDFILVGELVEYYWAIITHKNGTCLSFQGVMSKVDSNGKITPTKTSIPGLTGLIYITSICHEPAVLSAKKPSWVYPFPQSTYMGFAVNRSFTVCRFLLRNPPRTRC
jgi:hypothetical protein